MIDKDKGKVLPKIALAQLGEEVERAIE